jgi:hypothetical protein
MWADRIRVSDNRGRTLRELSDSATVRALARFAFGGNRRWSTQGPGKPVGAVSVSFFRGGHLRGHFSIGQDFLSTFACNAFRTTELSARERETMSKLLALRDSGEALSR